MHCEGSQKCVFRALLVVANDHREGPASCKWSSRKLLFSCVKCVLEHIHFFTTSLIIKNRTIPIKWQFQWFVLVTTRVVLRLMQLAQKERRVAMTMDFFRQTNSKKKRKFVNIVLIDLRFQGFLTNTIILTDLRQILVWEAWVPLCQCVQPSLLRYVSLSVKL